MTCIITVVIKFLPMILYNRFDIKIFRLLIEIDLKLSNVFEVKLVIDAFLSYLDFGQASEVAYPCLDVQRIVFASTEAVESTAAAEAPTVEEIPTPSFYPHSGGYVFVG